jgi:predicted phosphodiesterase
MRKILFVPDAHRPYHDKRAWALMMKASRWFRPDAVVILGDFADFYSVSSFSKDPTRLTQLDVEIDDCNKGLDELDSLGCDDKIFIAGNHCDRLQKYLSERAPALFSVLRIDKLFKLKQRGWKFTPYKNHTRLGKLYLTHDVGSFGRNAAHKAMDTFQHSVLTGHSHRMAYIVEGNAVGEQMLSAQFGWLGDVEKVDYKHRIQALREWALGFGIAYEDNHGIVFVQPVPIVSYRCVVGGKLFAA